MAAGAPNCVVIRATLRNFGTLQVMRTLIAPRRILNSLCFSNGLLHTRTPGRQRTIGISILSISFLLRGLPAKPRSIVSSLHLRHLAGRILLLMAPPDLQIHLLFIHFKVLTLSIILIHHQAFLGEHIVFVHGAGANVTSSMVVSSLPLAAHIGRRVGPLLLVSRIHVMATASSACPCMQLMRLVLLNVALLVIFSFFLLLAIVLVISFSVVVMAGPQFILAAQVLRHFSHAQSTLLLQMLELPPLMLSLLLDLDEAHELVRLVLVFSRELGATGPLIHWINSICHYYSYFLFLSSIC